MIRRVGAFLKAVKYRARVGPVYLDDSVFTDNGKEIGFSGSP